MVAPAGGMVGGLVDPHRRRPFEHGFGCGLVVDAPPGIVAEGTDMLIFQAAAQVQLMTGRTPKTDVMRGALEAELARRARVSGGGTAS